MSFIPVICMTPNCGHVWQSRGYGVSAPGAEATIAGCTEGPCAICGGMGRVPDGKYSTVSSLLFSPADMATVLQALLRVQNQLREHVPPNVIGEQIKIEPSLGWLKPFIPKDITEVETAMKIVGMLILFFAAIIQLSRGGQPQELRVPEETARAIEAIAEQLRSAPDDAQSDSR